jgi:hypothetical protein
MPNVIDKDLGLKKITANIKELGGYQVKIGIMGDAGEVEGVAVVDYAFYNEFGTSRIPARPFMSTTYDRHAEDTIKFAQYLVGGLIDGKSSVSKVLNTLGLHYQSKVRDTIRDAVNWAAPNAPSTIEQKGSSSPLINTGRMVGAVNYEVTKE